MPLLTFKLAWTAENFVLAANGVGAWTTTGGEVRVQSESETHAVQDFRRLLNAKSRIQVIN